MKQPKVLILGGGYAGLMAASRLARQQVAEITLINQSPQFEQRIRLHQVVAGQNVQCGNLAKWLAPAKAQLVTTTVREVRPDQRKVITDAGDHRYDYLIFTLGSQIARHRIEGAAAHGHCLTSQQPGQSLCERIGNIAKQRGHLLLIGAGLTHLETAAELAETHPGLQITLISPSNPLATFSTEAERHVRSFLQQAGITLVENCTVQQVHKAQCETSQGRMSFDLCLYAPGFVASTLLTDLGQPLPGCGRMPVLPTLQLPEDGRILIAGDSAACTQGQATPLRMGCAVALPMGAQAGENVAALIKSQHPRNFSFGFMLRCMSLGRKDGLIQTTQRDDHVNSRIFTGTLAAWIKEQVCRMTFHAPRWELRSGLRLYRWPSAPNAHLPASGEQTTPCND